MSEGEAIRQLLLGIGKHLHLCFNKGPLSVIPPQPLLSQDFYAFGHHRPPNDEKKGTSISLLRIEMHPANLNLRLTPVLTQGAAYSNFRTYYISRDVRPSEDSDIYRPYLRKLAELINLELGPRPILVNGIPGSGVNEFRQFLEDKHSIKLNGREFETHAVDLPRRWKQLGSAFQKLKREATNRTRSHVPLIVLLRAPLISAKTSLTEEPELVAQEEWGIRFREQLDTMTKERIAWILYFPNMTRDVSDLQANPGWSSLLIGPLGMHDHDMICEVYESRFPMPPQKHLRALTGGFTGFDKALCEFAETRFKKEDSSGAACLSSTIGKDLFDQALEPILAGGEGSPLLEQIRDFREWLQRNHQGNHIVKRISEALEQKRFRGMLSDGNYTPVTVEGLSPETLRALLEFGILTKDGSEVKVQLSLPFLAATRQAGRKIATLHIAFPGELRGVTKQLHEKLQKSGCVNYFYPELPPEKLTEGWKTRERKSVRASDGFLLVYGARVASSAFSGFLFEECQLAEQLNKDRLLVLVDGRKDQGLPSLVAEWQSIEPCEPWPDKAAQKIVEWVLTREDELTR